MCIFEYSYLHTQNSVENTNITHKRTITKNIVCNSNRLSVLREMRLTAFPALLAKYTIIKSIAFWLSHDNKSEKQLIILKFGRDIPFFISFSLVRFPKKSDCYKAI